MFISRHTHYFKTYPHYFKTYPHYFKTYPRHTSNISKHLSILCLFPDSPHDCFFSYRLPYILFIFRHPPTPPGLIGLFIPILACYQVNKEAIQRENQIEANFNPIIKSPKCFLRFDFLPVSKIRRPPCCSKVQSCFGKFINRIQIGATFCRW